MSKKEQFRYFVDFIIAFLVCTVVYFITVYISYKLHGDNKEGKKSPLSGDSFTGKMDSIVSALRSAPSLIGESVQATIGVIGQFFSKNVWEWIVGLFGKKNGVVTNTINQVGVSDKNVEVLSSSVVANDEIVTLNKQLDPSPTSPGVETTVQGGKKKKSPKRRRRSQKGGSLSIPDGITPIALMGALSVVFGAVVYNEARKEAFQKRLTQVLTSLKDWFNSKFPSKKE
jgi:hypothetical protein